MAAEDDCLDIISSILQPRPQQEEEVKEEEQQQAAEAPEQLVKSSDEEQPVQSDNSSSSSSSESTAAASASASTSKSSRSSSKPSKPEAPDKQVVKYFRSRISAMKSFVESTHRWVVGWMGRRSVWRMGGWQSLGARVSPQLPASCDGSSVC